MKKFIILLAAFCFFKGLTAANSMKNDDESPNHAYSKLSLLKNVGKITVGVPLAAFGFTVSSLSTCGFALCFKGPLQTNDSLIGMELLLRAFGAAITGTGAVAGGIITVTGGLLVAHGTHDLYHQTKHENNETHKKE